MPRGPYRVLRVDRVLLNSAGVFWPCCDLPGFHWLWRQPKCDCDHLQDCIFSLKVQGVGGLFSPVRSLLSDPPPVFSAIPGKTPPRSKKNDLAISVSPVTLSKPGSICLYLPPRFSHRSNLFVVFRRRRIRFSAGGGSVNTELWNRCPILTVLAEGRTIITKDLLDMKNKVHNFFVISECWNTRTKWKGMRWICPIILKKFL